MAKGDIVLADTYDLSVNPGDGEQNCAFSAYLMIICGWEDVEKFFQFKHKMYSLNEVAWVSFVSSEFCQMLIFFDKKMLENSTKNMHKVLVIFSSNQSFLLTTLPCSDCGCLTVL